MNHIPISNSSTISSIGHDPETGAMEVRFKSGKTYAYANVPAEQFEAFRNSESKGQYFHAFFRGNPKHAVEAPKE